ncbi:MAG: tRNA-dihydrouridine synthase [Parcubacteria group bacterium Gr01-1014_48]|nr:MAG: tRNA-dihydrouridine synthase [Parcubacteria group bacterium Greene0416_14]TSC74533.1 MAG: tRNA-dihydrouridine synthase [Parcubacteria group bacterium Gr01-1014_48]TSD01409.1 MAG: tRNA-dihydrouridine synthase [Parcubacteria group bacterium Greene1014_15]TSD08449.1 MAG: tRNA-dihydrouridine synthase [Parcubacteria group bacterium Greene0714_4]
MFWQKLKKPIFVLAPLADVTDAAFRRLIAKYGKPDVFFTEFVSADGLCSAGREHLLHDLIYTEAERPIVAQLFTGKPENMEKAATLVRELGFDGVDINMGCPDRAVEKQCAGAALMKNYSRARAVVAAAKQGAGKLPVSLKVRIGYNKNEIETWLPELLAEEPATITVHGRTRKEMSLVPAHWDVIARAVEIRNELKSKTLILGNGDVFDLVDAEQKVEEYDVDGVMLGRAIFGNPWLFDRNKGEVSVPEKLQIMIEHTKLFEELLGTVKNFAIMKKHYKAYVNGFDRAKELRVELMQAKNASDVEKIVQKFLTET